MSLRGTTAAGVACRGRAIQLAYSEQHGITPASIVKGIWDIAGFLQAESKVPGKRRKRRSVQARPCRSSSSARPS